MSDSARVVCEFFFIGNFIGITVLTIVVLYNQSTIFVFNRNVVIWSVIYLITIVLLWIIICGPANGVWINQAVLYIGFS